MKRKHSGNRPDTNAEEQTPNNHGLDIRPPREPKEKKTPPKKGKARETPHFLLEPSLPGGSRSGEAEACV